MSLHQYIEEHQRNVGKWVRSISTAFVLATTLSGLFLPEHEGRSPHTTREDALEESRKTITDYQHGAVVRPQSGSGAGEQREISFDIPPHATVFNDDHTSATLVLFDSNPRKPDVPTLKG